MDQSGLIQQRSSYDFSGLGPVIGVGQPGWGQGGPLEALLLNAGSNYPFELILQVYQERRTTSKGFFLTKGMGRIPW